MPLDSFPAPAVVPPPPSTARALPEGSPSSTAKMAALVVEELARASVSLLESSPEQLDAKMEASEDGQELVQLWAKKGGHRRGASELAQVRLVKPEPPSSRSASKPASGVRFLASGVAAVVLVALAALVGARFMPWGAGTGAHVVDGTAPAR
jgi:hypothetical protein